MCWFLRVYGIVLQNLLHRCFTNFIDWFYDCCGCCLGCCRCSDCGNYSNYCCCCNFSHYCCDKNELRVYQAKESNKKILSELNASQCTELDGNKRQYRILTLSEQHDYAIVDELDANYLQISQRKIETKTYYLIVDRAQAENILSIDHVDGMCLVRPYKQEDISIKYIVSVYAHRQYFHLFIRKVIGQEFYGIGQKKHNERFFRSPCDIIDFYSINLLQCSNKQLTHSLYLRPITI